MHYSKEQIKVALQREQQRKKAEDMLQQGVEPELTQEEMEERTHKEEVKQRAQRYERRMKKKEEQQEDETGELEDLVVEVNKLMGSSKPTRINLQEAAEFQNFVKDKMEELVEEMRGKKNLINPVRKLIRSLKLK